MGKKWCIQSIKIPFRNQLYKYLASVYHSVSSHFSPVWCFMNHRHLIHIKIMFLVLDHSTGNEFKPRWGMTSEVWWVSKLKQTQREPWRCFVGGRSAVCAVHGVGPCCACPGGWALPRACVQSAVLAVSKEGVRRIFLNDFMTHSPSLILPAVFFSHSPLTFPPAPTHSVALILPQGKVVSMHFSQAPINCLHLTRSECGLWVCRRNYSLSYFQRTMAAAPLDKPSLCQPQGWAEPLDNEKKLWTGPWGAPSGPEESQRGWVFLLCCLNSELREKLWRVGQKISQSRGSVKGSADLWRLGLLNEKTSTHSLTAEMEITLLGCFLESDCCEKCLNRLSFISSCGRLCMFRVNM